MPPTASRSVPDALAAALATDGVLHLIGAIFLAGLVYGFAGFGAALVFHPLATMVVAPVVGVAMLSTASLGAAAVVIPRALRVAELPQVAWILVPAVVALPPGVWVLVNADVTVLRWIISAVVAVTLLALISGWRRKVTPHRAALAAIGVGAGGLGGATGLHGPIMILFTLSGQSAPQVMRANMLLVLTSLGISMLPVMGAMGYLPAEVIWLGVMAAPAYMAGTAIGQAAFDPRRARLWRYLGYVIVGASVVAGLPLWS